MAAPHIGLVGCGRWGRLILRDLVSLEASVSVVAKGDDARFAAAAGAAVVDRLAALPGTDGIVVATPTSTHAEVIEALLPRRVPIYCEKPLCDDAGRARGLAAAAPDRLFVMDKWRYHRGVMELAAIARSGELGPVVGLRTTRLGYGHSHSDSDCVWTLLPHDLAIAIEIFGGLLPPRAAVADRADGPPEGTLSGMSAIAAADHGPWHVAEVGVRSVTWQRTVALFCRDGVASLEDAYADHLVIVGNPPPDGAKAEPRITRRPIAVGMPLLAELAAFVGHLAGGPPPRSCAAEGAAIVATIAEFRRLAGLPASP